MIHNIEQAALSAHPNNEHHRNKWKKAVAYLRAGRGWVADGNVGFKVAPNPTLAPEPPPKFADRVVTPISVFRHK